MINKSYFLAAMLLSLMPVTVEAQETDINSCDLRGEVVYQDDEVVFRQLDEHTWIGNGHRVYNESLYLIEGYDRALLIDAGAYVPELDKIAAKITSKPVTMIVTHAHSDHVGGVGAFPEVYLNAGDMPIVPPDYLQNYKRQIKYLNDGEVIDLGGREIEVVFTPGHTAGSTTFFDKARHYGFSGDAFGSTNLLVFINLSTEMYSAERIENYMKKNDIHFLFPGHYSGDNLETLQRVIDIKDMCREILDGERKPTVSNGNNGGMDMMVEDKGVRINFISPGWIDTANTGYEGPDAVQQPVGRVGNPLDIANMVLYLCSDKAGFITGENICIDGGMTHQMIYCYLLQKYDKCL